MAVNANRIYSATYSNVPVYEFSIAGNHVMRRRADDWINATHILKVADFDKPARTRILEREVQKGVHEKVQGGYGKYQGTWIPLEEGRALAEKNGVFLKLAPIFEYVPGDRSPPPAPKHATAQSSKPKPARQSLPPRRVPGKLSASKGRDGKPPLTDNRPAVPTPIQIPEEQYAAMYRVQATPDKQSSRTESDDEMMQSSQFSNSRKRKRNMEEAQQMSYADHQHLLWTDELLDYFMLQNSNEPLPLPPEPPGTIDLNRPVDEKGHTPMHWAAAMGDLTVVKDLIRRGARVDGLALNGESPLMRSVMFTNNWDKQTMDRLISILHPTAGLKDWFGSTVFHHIAVTTCSKSKYQCARYYLETVLAKLTEIYPPQQVAQLLDQQDQNGDTAIQLAARFGARKCARILINYGASVDIPNIKGETADELIKDLNARRRDRYRQGSSSPFAMDSTNGVPRQRSSSGPLNNGAFATSITRDRTSTTTHYRSEAATLLAQQLPTLIASRAEALAAALEAELASREVEAADADRLLAQRRREIEHLQQQSLALASRDEDDSFDDRQRAELDQLMRESEKLLEVEQSAEIARAVREEEAKVPPHMRTQSTSSGNGNGHGAGGTIDTEKLHLAHLLGAQQAARTVLVADVVAAQSLAGSGGGRASTVNAVNGTGNADMTSTNNSTDASQQNLADPTTTATVDGITSTMPTPDQRHELYKRLITGALGVRAEDVESLLPEMLRELEEAREEAEAAVGAALAAGADDVLVRTGVGSAGVGQGVDGEHTRMQSLEGVNGGLNGNGQVAGAAIGGAPEAVRVAG